MNETTTPLSPYLEQMVKENYLLTKEAQAVNRLPDDLQEKAVELSEDLRVQAMEKIVSDLLNPKPAEANIATSSELISAFKEDLLDRFFPYMGRMGWVIRERISQAWESGKKKRWLKWMLITALLSILWSPFWWMARAPFRWMHRLWSHRYTTVAVHAGVPIPQITEARYVAGHKMRLQWKPLGEGYAYRIFYGKEEPTSPLDDGRTVNTPGAIVNLYAGGDNQEMWVAVQAIAPDANTESELSKPVRFDLKPWNKEYSVEPLALSHVEGLSTTTAQGPHHALTLASVPSAAPSPAIGGRGPGQPQGESFDPDQDGELVEPPRVMAPSKIAAVAHTAEQSRNDGDIKNASNSKSKTKKKSFFSAFGRHLLDNADGAVSSAIPISAVGEGAVAVKRAAVGAHEESRAEPGAEIPAPTGLKWERLDNSHKIRLWWDSPGRRYRYNLYETPYQRASYFTLQNEKPLKKTVFEWTAPKTDKPVFLFYVVTADGLGGESKPSNRITVDLR